VADFEENTQGAVQYESAKKEVTTTEDQCAYWKAEIRACDKELHSFHQRGEKVVERYRDEKRDALTAAGTTRRFNILWSNIRTMKPAIFGRAPQVVVERRFKDPDPVARVAALIAERATKYQMSTQRAFLPALKAVLEDRLLPGMGTVWVRYEEPQSAEYAEDAGGTESTDADETVTTAVPSPNTSCLAKVDYVYWRDFGFISARSWDEVPAVWRRVYMSRDQLIERFGAEVGGVLPLDYTPGRIKDAGIDTDEPKNSVFKQAAVYEIWDKRSSKISWVSMAHPDLLDQKDDPVRFPDFFPCPRPLFATNTTGNLVPIPDFYLYQDQANELDEITERLYFLVKALKVVGVYDKENEGVQNMLRDSFENTLIPVDNWAALAERGGVKGVVDFMPLDQIIEVVEKLYEKRTQLVQDIYQITGLSDIVRGSSNPNETAKAQTIKAQFASVRLQDMQDEFALFVTDVLRLMGHVIADLFPDAAIISQSGIVQSEDGQRALKEAQQAMQAQQQAAMQQVQASTGVPMPPMAPPQHQDIITQALALLRSDKDSFRIEISADSLVTADLDAERQRRNEFLTATTQFLQEAMPAIQQNQNAAPLMKTLLMWGVRGFRVGRDVEGEIEAAIDQLVSSPPPQPPPDPKLLVAQAKMQGDQQRMQMEAQQEQQRMNNEMQKMQAEMAMQKAELDAKVEAIQKQSEAKVYAILMEAGIEAQVKQQEMAQQAQATAIKTDASVNASEQQFQQQLQHNDAAHQQTMQHTADAAKQKAALQPPAPAKKGPPSGA
jgi:hypothetical protein